MIVEPNNNENGLNGFSTIARAKNNKSKDNTLYNFDYYINQGSLKAEEVSEDLYAEKGLLYRLGKINNKIASVNEKIIAQ
jgi:glutaredoxin 2